MKADEHLWLGGGVKMVSRIYVSRFSFAMLLAVYIGACSETPTTPRRTNTSSVTSISFSDIAKLTQPFDSLVKPLLRERCVSCHTESGGGSGPKSIFDASFMIKYAKTGTSGQDNNLIKKMLNRLIHGGGPQCVKIDESPCAEVVSWAKQIFAPKASSTHTSVDIDPREKESRDQQPSAENSPKLASLETIYNSEIKSIVDKSCNGQGCHSTRKSNLTTFVGLKENDSSSIAELQMGRMPKERTISNSDKQVLLQFLQDLTKAK